MLAQIVRHAQWGDVGTWGIAEVAIAIIIVAAIVAVVYVALRKFGVAIPDWVQQLFWILAVAVVCIVAIRLLMRL